MQWGKLAYLSVLGWARSALRVTRSAADRRPMLRRLRRLLAWYFPAPKTPASPASHSVEIDDALGATSALSRRGGMPLCRFSGAARRDLYGTGRLEEGAQQQPAGDGHRARLLDSSAVEPNAGKKLQDVANPEPGEGDGAPSSNATVTDEAAHAEPTEPAAGPKKLTKPTCVDWCSSTKYACAATKPHTRGIGHRVYESAEPFS
jgi:hypothetical protein